jgi:hypothetical protein
MAQAYVDSPFNTKRTRRVLTLHHLPKRGRGCVVRKTVVGNRLSPVSCTVQQDLDRQNAEVGLKGAVIISPRPRLGGTTYVALVEGDLGGPAARACGGRPGRVISV